MTLHKDMLVGQKVNKLTLLEKINATRKDGQKEIRGRFMCDCGKERNVLLCSVRSGKQKSCGCYRPLKLDAGESAFNQLFRDYKWSAERRNHSFDLDISEFRKLTKQNCFYCGTQPNQVYSLRRGHGIYTYNGIDRVDNAIGYSVENCIPCCGICNLCKGGLSQEAFMSQVQKISHFLSARLQTSTDQGE